MIDIELIIFDLDGTLIDSKVDITHALNYTLRKFNHHTLKIDEVERLIGGGARNLLKKAMGIQNKEDEDKAYEIFINYYSDHLIDNTLLYPSVNELLEHFNLKKMAIISNKPTELCIKALEGLKILFYFSLVLGGDSMRVKKPSPAPLLKAMKELGAAKEKTIMVGDSPVDVEAGKRAGIITCGVTYGYSSKEALNLSEADIMVNNLAELKEIIGS